MDRAFLDCDIIQVVLDQYKDTTDTVLVTFVPRQSFTLPTDTRLLHMQARQLPTGNRTSNQFNWPLNWKPNSPIRSEQHLRCNSHNQHLRCNSHNQHLRCNSHKQHLQWNSHKQHLQWNSHNFLPSKSLLQLSLLQLSLGMGLPLLQITLQ